MTNDIENYKWSSYQEYIRQERIVNSNFALAMLATEKDKALARFRSFHLEANDEKFLDITAAKNTSSDNEIRRLAS